MDYCIVTFRHPFTKHFPQFDTKEDAHDFRIAMNRSLPKPGFQVVFLFDDDNEVYEIDSNKKV